MKTKVCGVSGETLAADGGVLDQIVRLSRLQKLQVCVSIVYSTVDRLRVTPYFCESAVLVKIQTMNKNIQQYCTPKHLIRDVLSILVFLISSKENCEENLKRDKRARVRKSFFFLFFFFVFFFLYE